MSVKVVDEDFMAAAREAVVAMRHLGAELADGRTISVTAYRECGSGGTMMLTATRSGARTARFLGGPADGVVVDLAALVGEAVPDAA